MPNVALYDIKGNTVGEIALSEDVFGQPVNESVLHDVVVAHLANCRQGTYAPSWSRSDPLHSLFSTTVWNA